MNSDVIKEFLVSLGFSVDEAGAKKFDNVIVGATANVIKMGVAVEAAALTVVAFTTKIASGLDNLYWSSQRTGATAQGISQISYAVSQMGGTAEGAKSSLESLARFMRSSPGAEGFLNRLGVETKNANGSMRDMADIFSGVGQRLSGMSYYRANQYAQMLGIDENTLLAMRRGVGQFSTQYTEMAKAIGYNANQAAASSNKFMTAIKSFGEMASMAKNKIGSNLADGLAGSIDSLRKRILDNFPQIESVITKGIKAILWMADAIGRIVYRIGQAAGDIHEWWKQLDDGSKGLIKTFGAVIVAWKLINSAFLMSPIGIVTSLLITLGLLWDDYKAWKEGGKSLIDWKAWEPAINNAKKAISWIRNNLIKLSDAVGGWQNSLAILATFIAGAWVSKVLGAFSKISGLPIPPWLKLWGLYAGYIVSDRENIASSAKSSLNVAKGNVGDALRWMGFDTDYGKNPNTVQGTPEGALDIPGNAPAQHAQSVKRPKPTTQGKMLLDSMAPILQRLESAYKLPEGLLKSVAITESSGNPNAVGPRTKYGQAKGLFQFIDSTARGLGLQGNDAFDPEKSAQAAAKYLSQLLQQNGGNLEKALASYNWGIGNVQQHGMDLMPQETRNYIPKVLSNMGGGRGVIQQETNINIHGVSSPQEAARLVADRQSGVNSILTQQIPRVAG